MESIEHIMENEECNSNDTNLAYNEISAGSSHATVYKIPYSWAAFFLRINGR